MKKSKSGKIIKILGIVFSSIFACTGIILFIFSVLNIFTNNLAVFLSIILISFSVLSILFFIGFGKLISHLENIQFLIQNNFQTESESKEKKVLK